MGCFCSCFQVHEVEEIVEVDVSNDKYSCFSSFTQTLKNKYGAFVSASGLHADPSPGQEPVIANTEADNNNPRGTSSLSNSPSPSTGNLELQRSIVNRNAGINSSPSQADIPNGQDVLLNPARTCRDKIVESPKANKPEASPSAASEKVPLTKDETKHRFFSSLDEEDVCPTCLEDYTDENPKITTQCKHDYHLGCIYEWMERSPNCPICNKILLFAELT